jgi:hypothetical protein
MGERFRWCAIVSLVSCMASMAFGQALPAGCSGTAPVPPVAAVHGQWIGPWDWRASLGQPPLDSCGTQPVDPLEFAHGVLLATGDRPGQVAMWANAANGPGTGVLYFDPAAPNAPTFTISNVPSNVFCSGHTFNRDGTLFIMGGSPVFAIPPLSAPNQGYLFDPQQIVAPPPLTSSSPFIVPPIQGIWPRYYPSVISLTKAGGALAIVIGGTTYTYAGPPPPGQQGNCTYPPSNYQCNLKDLEILYPGTTSTVAVADPANQVLWDWYPVLFHLSSGLVFVAGDTHIPGQAEFSGNAEGGSWFITPPAATPPAAVTVSAPIFGGDDRYYGVGILIHQLVPTPLSDRVLYFGGSSGCNPAWGPPGQMPCHGDLRVHASVKEFRPGVGATGTWHIKSRLNCPRIFMNAVILPTKQIFCVGGSTTDPDNDPLQGYTPIYHGEIFDPGADHNAIGSTAFTAPAPPVPGSNPAKYTPRLYHHLALLLPDASVLVAGGNQLCPQSVHGFSELSGEVYQPPYFFQGTRPSIVSSPPRAHFSSAITVTVNVPNWPTATLDRFVLIRPGSLTHHFDADQRYIELAFAHTGAGHMGENFSVTLPSSSLGPPGYYMLFAVMSSGGNRIPSTAAFIQLP